MQIRANRIAHGLRDSSVLVCLGALAAHVVYRAWALYNSWFFSDDFRLLLEAEETPLSLRGLLDPFDSQFMPLALMVVEAIESSGELNWALAATFSLAGTALAGGACYLMLVTLFGRGWRIVPLLLIYLSTCTTMPALMWWAASLNQVLPQACFFLAVASWVTYMRTRRTRWAVATALVVVVALGFYVKALLILPALAVLTLGYFYGGPLRRRARDVVTELWPVLAPAIVLTIGYVAFYRAAVPQPFAGSDAAKIGEVANSLIGKAFPTALLGGPWQWWNTNPPIVLAQPPDIAISLSWVVLGLVVTYSVLSRRNAWPSWLLLATNVLFDFALLATSRGQEYGALAGMDYRYLTDTAPVAVLACGLAFLPLRGAPESSRPREPAVLNLTVPWAVPIGLTAVVCVGGAISSTGYVSYWHHHHAAKDYVPALADSLHQNEGAVLVNQTLPSQVMPDYSFPMNQTSEFVRLVHSDVSFAEQGVELFLADGSGRLGRVNVVASATTGQGPREGCGWLVGTRTKRLPMDPPLIEGTWWVRVGVLAPSASTVTIDVDTESRTLELPGGLSSALARLEVPEGTDEVTVSSEGSERICVDRVDAGELVTQP